MPRTIIRNATIVTMDPERRVLVGHDLVVEGDRIAALAPASQTRVEAGDDAIDGRGRLVLPGFVNTHVHTVQQLGRGLADDVDLMTLLHGRVFPYESNVGPEDSYASTLLFGLEQIQNGTTTFADAGIQHVEPTVRAVTELGIRGALCLSITDDGDGLPAGWKLPTDECLAIQEEAFGTVNGAADGRLRWWLGLRTLFNNSDRLLEGTAALAERLDTRAHMHVAQSPGEVGYCRATRGTTVARHLDRMGLLSERLLAVHGLYLEEEELDLLAERRVSVSHSPGAGLKIMGLPKIVGMLDRGITVGLATDSGASNNRNSMPDEMWLATLLQKGAHANPSALTAQQVLAMATIDAARALGWDAEIGSLEVGKKADLCVIDPWTANMQPLHDPIAALVFCMKSENITHTMCDGVWLMRDRQLTRLNATEVLREASARALAIGQRAGIALPPRFPTVHA